MGKRRQQQEVGEGRSNRGFEKREEQPMGSRCGGDAALVAAVMTGWLEALMVDVVVGGDAVKRMVEMDGTPTTPTWPWRRPEVEKEVGGEGDVARPEGN